MEHSHPCRGATRATVTTTCHQGPLGLLCRPMAAFSHLSSPGGERALRVRAYAPGLLRLPRLPQAHSAPQGERPAHRRAHDAACRQACPGTGLLAKEAAARGPARP